MKLLADFTRLLTPTTLPILDASSDAITGMAIIFWVVVLVGILLRVFRRMHTPFGASHWTLTQAIVQSGFTATREDTDLVPSRNNQAGVRLVLQYSYSAAGEYYSGYLLLKQLYRSRERAMEEFAEWKGRPLMVRYNPEQPQRSVCLRQDGAPPNSSSLGDVAPNSIDLVSLPLD